MLPEITSFHDFMAYALYDPVSGYYMTEKPKWGKDGDYITAPQVSSLFGACLAEYYINLISKNPLYKPCILEIGPGNGKLAADILSTLEKAQALPEKYYLHEISPVQKKQQQVYFEQNHPQWLARLAWVDNLDTMAIEGMIIANEILDAMPVHLIEFNFVDPKHKTPQEVFVENFEHYKQFILKPIENKTLLHEATRIKNLIDNHPFRNTFPHSTYRVEINPYKQSFLKTIKKALKKGGCLIFDYGEEEDQLYHPARTTGTLLCHKAHRIHDNPLIHVGKQDITSHVNFTKTIEVAKNLGFACLEYTTQAHFLMSQNLLKLAHTEKNTPQLSQAIFTLTSPTEMGEIIKVLMLAKNEN